MVSTTPALTNKQAPLAAGSADAGSRSVRQLVEVVLLTLLSIVIHEGGHFVVYKLGGYPVRVTLQSVRPIGAVDPGWNAVALAAGPLTSVLAAIVCLVLARRHGDGFGWVTASFTNATLRIFPCTMELVRAITGGHPFSDEDAVIGSITQSSALRAVAVGLLLAIYAALAVIVARRYRFADHRRLKTVAVYALSLAVGIAIVIVDEIIHTGR
jgi:hypothetical protein